MSSDIESLKNPVLVEMLRRQESPSHRPLDALALVKWLAVASVTISLVKATMLFNDLQAAGLVRGKSGGLFELTEQGKESANILRDVSEDSVAEDPR